MSKLNSAIVNAVVIIHLRLDVNEMFVLYQSSRALPKLLCFTKVAVLYQSIYNLPNYISITKVYILYLNISPLPNA